MNEVLCSSPGERSYTDFVPKFSTDTVTALSLVNFFNRWDSMRDQMWGIVSAPHNRNGEEKISVSNSQHSLDSISEEGFTYYTAANMGRHPSPALKPLA